MPFQYHQREACNQIGAKQWPRRTFEPPEEPKGRMIVFHSASGLVVCTKLNQVKAPADHPFHNPKASGFMSVCIIGGRTEMDNNL